MANTVVTKGRAEDCGYMLGALLRIAQQRLRDYSQSGEPMPSGMAADVAMLCEVAENLAGECLEFAEATLIHEGDA